MDPIKLSVESRKGSGKSLARLVRKEEKIPAVLYGKNAEPISLKLIFADLKKALDNPLKRNTLLSLDIDGKEYLALVKDVQFDTMTRQVMHVDFYMVAIDQEVTRDVPVVSTGKAIGESLGGVFIQFIRTMQVTCTPELIPFEISLDVTELDINDRLTVGDAAKVEGVKFEHKDSELLFEVIMAREVEEEEVDEDELEEGAEGAEGDAEGDSKDGKKDEAKDAS